MTEKELLKKSGFYTSFILFFVSLFWFLFSIQISFGGYTGGPASGIDAGINSRSTSQANWQVGSSGVYVLRLGIENVTGSGSAGYMTGTNTYYPRIEWTPTLGTFNFVGTGSYPVTIQTNGIGIPSAGSVSGKLDAVGGVGTNNTFNNPTFAGLGTITASFGANGLVISPAEYSAVNNATGELQVQITTATGSITNHTHTGSDGTIQVSHTNLTNKGTQTHTQIDDFIASKAAASGIASLDTNSLVVQNPSNATNSPAASKIPIALGTGKLNDSWLSDNVTKLGTPTTSNISEGSNLYHTEARINAIIGSSTVGSRLNEQITSVADGHHFVYDLALGKWKNATSTASIGFSGVTGTPTDNSFFSTTPGINKIPYSTDGTLNSWVSGLFKVITLPATTTVQTGSPTASKIYVSSSQVLSVLDTPMHANTKLMLRMNGASGSQVFTDSSVNAYTVTTVGNTYQSTSIYKFGGASGYFDGTGDALTIADSDDWWMNTDYTVRGWIYPTITAAGAIVFDGNMSPDHLWWLNITTGDILKFSVQDSGNANFDTVKSDTAVTLNAWNHVAFTREGNIYRCFVNGSQGEAITETSVRENNAYNLYIGAFNPAYNDPFDGYMDNIEIIKGTALYTGTFTVPISDSTTGTLTKYSTKIVAPGGGTNPQVLLEMQTWDTTNGTAEENSIASGTSTVNYFPGSLTVFGAAPLGTSTLYRAHFDGGVLSNSGYYTQCFDGIKVITDDREKSLVDRYLRSFYDIKIKESYARKNNIPWLEASDMAKKQYKQEKFQAWKSANIGLTKYYVDEFLPGSGTVQSFQVGMFETDYDKFVEEFWASDLAQNDYIQDVKDVQDIDKRRKMLRPSLSDPGTPAIIKAGDGSALNIDNTLALAILAMHELDERLGSATAEIEALKALINK